MQVKCNYDDMMASLANISIVVDDVMNSEDTKNVIIRVHKGTHAVELVGINQLITYTTEMEEGTYSVEVEDAEFKDAEAVSMQIKSKELISFLSTFKSVRRTKVEDIEFKTVSNKINATVREVDVDNGKEYTSSWLFDNVPFKANVLNSINIAVPEEFELFDISALALYTSSLLPIMQSGNNLYAKMVFAESNVFAFCTTSTSMVKNFLGDEFTNLCLSCRALNLIKSAVCTSDCVEFAKTPERLCFKMGTSYAFIRYETKLPKYEIYEKLIDKSHAIVLDRQYFKDVLKRLSLINESIMFTINADESTVNVKNSKFHQELSILDSKAMSELGTVTFKVMPDVFNKAIIGDDNAFSNNVFLYLAPKDKGGYTLIFTDDSGSWHSVASVR